MSSTLVVDSLFSHKLNQSDFGSKGFFFFLTKTGLVDTIAFQYVQETCF